MLYREVQRPTSTLLNGLLVQWKCPVLVRIMLPTSSLTLSKKRNTKKSNVTFEVFFNLTAQATNFKLLKQPTLNNNREPNINH
mmetsp:Transcript_30422/g.42391  ORF Transcript_30422/g.42391 Transcript_30422/m.42391 type:complete len:83 (-) Transcript_30422:252-500(-)